jgi:hypothetical protein
MATRKELASGLTAERARQLLHYDPESGKLFWRADVYTGKPKRLFRQSGSEAGTAKDGHYVIVCIDYTDFFGHRLAWLIQTGEWPERELDHIDMDRRNNRWVNLREATGNQNRANSKGRARSGFKGVTTHKYSPGSFMAQITVNGANKYLGSYRTPEEAHAAYCRAARLFFGEFARSA